MAIKPKGLMNSKKILMNGLYQAILSGEVFGAFHLPFMAKAIAEADNATEDQKQEATVAQAAAAEAAADLNNATDALSKAKEEAEAARAAHGVIPQGGSRQFSFKNKKKKGGRRKRGRHGYSLKRKGSKKKSRRDSRRK